MPQMEVCVQAVRIAFGTRSLVLKKEKITWNLELEASRLYADLPFHPGVMPPVVAFAVGEC